MADGRLFHTRETKQQETLKVYHLTGRVIGIDNIHQNVTGHTSDLTIHANYKQQLTLHVLHCTLLHKLHRVLGRINYEQ